MTEKTQTLVISFMKDKERVFLLWGKTQNVLNCEVKPISDNSHKLRCFDDMVSCKRAARRFASHNFIGETEMMITTVSLVPLQKISDVDIQTPKPKSKKTKNRLFVIGLKHKKKLRFLTKSPNGSKDIVSANCAKLSANETRLFTSFDEAKRAGRKYANRNRKSVRKVKIYSAFYVIGDVVADAQAKEPRLTYSPKEMRVMKCSNKPEVKARQLDQVASHYIDIHHPYFNFEYGFDVTHFKAFCRRLNEKLHWPNKYIEDYIDSYPYRIPNYCDGPIAYDGIYMAKPKDAFDVDQWFPLTPDGETPQPSLMYLSDTANKLRLVDPVNFCRFMRHDPLIERSAEDMDKLQRGVSLTQKDYTREEMLAMSKRQEIVEL